MRMLRNAALAFGIIGSPVCAAGTTPYDFVSAYVLDLAAGDRARLKGYADYSRVPSATAMCLRDRAAWAAQLKRASRTLGGMNLNLKTDLNSAPQLAAELFGQQLVFLEQITRGCKAFAVSPRPVPHPNARTGSSKSATLLEGSDGLLLNIVAIAFRTIVDPTPQADNRTRLTITKAQREALLGTIATSFPEQAPLANQTYAAVAVRTLRDRLREARCSNDH